MWLLQMLLLRLPYLFCCFCFYVKAQKKALSSACLRCIVISHSRCKAFYEFFDALKRVLSCTMWGAMRCILRFFGVWPVGWSPCRRSKLPINQILSQYSQIEPCSLIKPWTILGRPLLAWRLILVELDFGENNEFYLFIYLVGGGGELVFPFFPSLLLDLLFSSYFPSLLLSSGPFYVVVADVAFAIALPLLLLLLLLLLFFPSIFFLCWCGFFPQLLLLSHLFSTIFVVAYLCICSILKFKWVWYLNECLDMK